MYEPPKPKVTITKIASNTTTINTNLALDPNTPYPLNYSLEIPQGKRSEISLSLSSELENYARMFIRYNPTGHSGVKVNASSLYLKGSNIYKIYIDNSSQSVNLSELGIYILYDEQPSLFHNDNGYVYVELGTLMMDNASENNYQNEYIKWRLIGTGTQGSSNYKRFTNGTVIPTTGIGVFVLDSNTLIKRPSDNLPLTNVVYNNSYNSTNHSESGWTSIKVNDYATSTIREYLNGMNVYKNCNIIDWQWASIDTTSHYSNMYTDFNIDTEHDDLFNSIIGRTLSDLYSQMYGSPNGGSVTFPNALSSGDAFYRSSHKDKFWLLSYKEAETLFANDEARKWPSDSPQFYWLRSPNNETGRIEHNVTTLGNVGTIGDNLYMDHNVRPAMLISF